MENCVYCGKEKTDDFSVCCGEVHFEEFKEMSKNPDDLAAFESVSRHVDRLKVDLDSLLLKYRDDPFKFHCIKTAIGNANEIIYRVETAIFNS